MLDCSNQAKVEPQGGLRAASEESVGAKDLPGREEQYGPQACVKTIAAKLPRTRDSLLHCPRVG